MYTRRNKVCCTQSLQSSLFWLPPHARTLPRVDPCIVCIHTKCESEFPSNSNQFICMRIQINCFHFRFVVVFFLMRPLANSRKSIPYVAAASSPFSFVFCGAAAAAYIEIWTSIRILIYVNIHARVVHDGSGYILYSYTLVYIDLINFTEASASDDTTDQMWNLICISALEELTQSGVCCAQIVYEF